MSSDGLGVEGLGIRIRVQAGSGTTIVASGLRAFRVWNFRV